jgi:TfoX/Sxy family transcriptional regulator of competence genes
VGKFYNPMRAHQKRQNISGFVNLKWYVEEETKELRESFEKEILKWPNVTSKKMFGCPCYLVNGRMFAGMVTKGIVITKLTTEERDELEKIHEIKPFVAGKRIIKNWVHVALTPKEIMKILPFVKKSYERTRKT